MGCGNTKSVKAKNPDAGKPMQTPLKASMREAVLKDVRSDFKMGKIIGSGHFGTVRLAVSRKGEEGTTYAIKTIKKTKIQRDEDALKREVRLMVTLDHPNIVNLFDLYEDIKYYHLIMEYCSGGELFERIIQIGRYTEERAAQLMKQIISAVKFLHDNNIAHRDLKPENFLFETTENRSILKLIDFGLSNKFSSNRGKAEKMETIVGTPYYVAPEVLKGSYGPLCDMWSIGVIMFILLSGKYPFVGTTENEIFKKILTQDVNVSSGVWKGLSLNAKDLIVKLLCKNPNKRISAKEALSHKWFTDNSTAQICVDPEIIDSLRQYRATSKLKKEAMSVLVKQLKTQELQELRQVFVELDTTQTGTLTADEIQEGLKRFGGEATAEEIAEIIRQIDYLGNGEINYSEFLAATIESKGQLTDIQMWSVFQKFDRDNSGFITEQNLLEIMHKAGKQVTPEEVREMINEVDLAQDQQISFDEFKAMMMDRGEDLARMGSMSTMSMSFGMSMDRGKVPQS